MKIWKLGTGLLSALLAAGALAVDTPLDISRAANRGFQDEAPGDGKGGWSDQGPENDMSGFDLARKDYEGVTFAILDPAKNGGRSVITFDSPQARTGLLSAAAAPPVSRPSARFLYLLHTTCWNGEPQGATIGSVDVIFCDGSTAKLPVRSGIEVGNWWNAGGYPNGKVVVRKPNKAAEVGVFLSKLELAPKDKDVASVAFTTMGKVAWIVVGASLSSKDVKLEEPGIVYAASDTWKAVDMSDIQVKTGSALDLSSIIEPGPAGKHGRAIIGKGGFLAFEDSPDTPRRLIGFNGFWSTIYGGAFEGHPERVVKFAELVKRQGYDMVRPLALEGYIMKGAEADCQFNPVRLDVVDRMIAEFKKQGVYTWLTVGAYCVGFKKGRPLAQTGMQMVEMYLDQGKVRENWKLSTERMLAHVNPYTGVAWKDEPAIVCLEFFNEQDLSFMGAKDQLAPATNPVWRDWLRAKYKTPEALAAAWGSKATPFESQEIPDNLYTKSPMSNDYGLFWREQERNQYRWCEEVVRKAGYKGLTSQNNTSVLLGDTAVRWECSPAADMHAYFAHPSKFTNPGSRCKQGSSVGEAAHYWRALNSSRLSGRPFFVTEHNHGFWNPYQHEDGLLFASYSALQGFTEVTVHEDAVAFEAKRVNADFSVAVSPVARANEFLAACLFRRGDVQEANRRVELRVPPGYLDTDGHANQAINSDQNRIGLIAGFSVDFPGLPLPATVPAVPSRADLVIAPDKGAQMEGSAWFASVKEDGKAGAFFCLPAFVKAMKDKGLLPQDNLSDPERGVFQSVTGEITLRQKENLLKVVTPRSEGVTLEANKSEKLNCLDVKGSTAAACVAVCSMDGKPLAESARMVLIYSTEIVNSGMELSGDRVTLRKVGVNPPLMRVGKLTATLRNANGAGLALYALGFDGSRREKLPLAVKDGVLEIALDTAALKQGPTSFFELVME